MNSCCRPAQLELGYFIWDAYSIICNLPKQMLIKSHTEVKKVMIVIRVVHFPETTDTMSTELKSDIAGNQFHLPIYPRFGESQALKQADSRFYSVFLCEYGF